MLRVPIFRPELIHCSAPANIMLMGEHAVLFGYRAIACALASRVDVTIKETEDGMLRIYSKLGNLSIVHSEPSLKGYCSKILADKTHPDYWARFVLASLVALGAELWRDEPAGRGGLQISIESEFSHLLGLGSSAAVVAAMLGAGDSYAASLSDRPRRQREALFAIGLEVIRRVQGSGSGTDLAASLYGGIVSYQDKKVTPLIPAAFDYAGDSSNKHRSRTLTGIGNIATREAYPYLSLHYAGYKTPTPEVIALVASRAKKEGAYHAKLYELMDSLSFDAELAITKQDWEALGACMNAYHGLLDSLGVSDAMLSHLVYRARERKTTLGAKISGSGLGDCIIVLSSSAQDDSLSIDPKGLIYHA